jgi:hypothetical protein
MKKSLLKMAVLGCLLLLLGLFLAAPALAAKTKTDSGSVGGVWSCWYWDYMDGGGNDPGISLFDDGGPMNKFDVLVGNPTGKNAYGAQGWEWYMHGPPQNPDDWWGHCHAWSGAALWEKQPNATKKVKNAGTGQKVSFRIRDRKGLICEAYYDDAYGSIADFMISQPSAGLFWFALRQEIKGYHPMHGKKRGFIGELYYDTAGDSQVWNYPLWKYKVTYWFDTDGSTYGYIQVWGGSDGMSAYADKTKLYSRQFIYGFQGVFLDPATKMPTTDGEWIALQNQPASQLAPDSIWRPVFPTYWSYFWDTMYYAQGNNESGLGNFYIFGYNGNNNAAGALDYILSKKHQ